MSVLVWWRLKDVFDHLTNSWNLCRCVIWWCLWPFLLGGVDVHLVWVVLVVNLPLLGRADCKLVCSCGRNVHFTVCASLGFLYYALVSMSMGDEPKDVSLYGPIEPGHSFDIILSEGQVRYPLFWYCGGNGVFPSLPEGVFSVFGERAGCEDSSGGRFSYPGGGFGCLIGCFITWNSYVPRLSMTFTYDIRRWSTIRSRLHIEWQRPLPRSSAPRLSLCTLSSWKGQLPWQPCPQWLYLQMRFQYFIKVKNNKFQKKNFIRTININSPCGFLCLESYQKPNVALNPPTIEARCCLNMTQNIKLIYIKKSMRIECGTALDTTLNTTLLADSGHHCVMGPLHNYYTKKNRE